jgi:hypothetical protein
MGIIEDAAMLGRENSTMARLAMRAAQAVVKGEADPSDAGDIYAAYYNSAVEHTQSPDSRKAQASKLRQVMEFAKEQRKDALKLLERAVALHMDGASKPMAMWPLYRCLLDVSREQLKAPREFTDKQLIKIMTKPARRNLPIAVISMRRDKSGLLELTINLDGRVFKGQMTKYKARALLEFLQSAESGSFEFVRQVGGTGKEKPGS